MDGDPSGVTTTINSNMKRVGIIGHGNTGTALVKDVPGGVLIIHEQEMDPQGKTINLMKDEDIIRELETLSPEQRERRMEVFKRTIEEQVEKYEKYDVTHTTAVFHPKKHTSQSYRSQQRRKKKRRKKR